jgi:hypothetical protein
MSAQPIWKSKDEEYAYYRRRDHANIEGLQNLVVAEIAHRAQIAWMVKNPDAEKINDFTMPANVRSLISALQGTHGGGKVPFEEFSRNYLTLGSQLQFTGTDTAIRARVRDWINALDDWQYLVGVQLFVIDKGGKPVYDDKGKQKFNDDGSPVRTSTRLIDYLKPRVDSGVQRARFSEQWKGNDANGIKAHPGLALAAQVDAVIKELPKLGTRAESGTEKEPVGKQLVSVYEEKQEDRLLASIEKVADEIDARQGDSDLWWEKFELKISRARQSRLKTKRARYDEDSLAAVLQDEMQHANATTNTCNSEGDMSDFETPTIIPPLAENPASGAVVDEGAASLGKKNLTQGFIGVLEDSASEGLPDMLEWALLWASRGIPVFPLHEAIDGICTCSCSDHWRKVEGRWVQICEGDKHVCGSECASPGKHPRSDRKLGMSKGVKMASLDPEKIKLWWGKHPTANIGGRMLGKIGFDVDPKNGGNASLYDLCEKFGTEWLDTWENVSGSGGPHFIFDNPTGISFKNSAGKLGLGLDTRGDDGYLVMPPSGHVSGGTYAVVSPNDFRPFPQFLIDLLNKPKSENEIEYQDAPNGPSGGGWGEKFLDGHRNDGLLAYGLGRMRHAWERTEEEHYQQLSRVNQARCVPPLDDEEVRSLAAHVAYDYASLYGVNAAKQEAA